MPQRKSINRRNVRRSSKSRRMKGVKRTKRNSRTKIKKGGAKSAAAVAAAAKIAVAEADKVAREAEDAAAAAAESLKKYIAAHPDDQHALAYNRKAVIGEIDRRQAEEARLEKLAKGAREKVEMLRTTEMVAGQRDEFFKEGTQRDPNRPFDLLYKKIDEMDRKLTQWQKIDEMVKDK